MIDKDKKNTNNILIELKKIDLEKLIEYDKHSVLHEFIKAIYFSVLE